MAIKKDMLVEKYIEALESGTIPWENLKSNIVKGLQTQSEVNEIYKKPDIEVLKNLKIDKPQINKTMTFGRGR